MKKFVFRLQVLLGIKEAMEKQQKVALAQAEKRLTRLKGELISMQDGYKRTNTEFQERCSGGMSAYEAQFYGNYFAHMQELIAGQLKRIAAAEVERTRCQVALVQTVTEIKVLNKFREKQYQEYLVEVAKEQEKEIGDFVSYQVTSKPEGEFEVGR